MDDSEYLAAGVTSVWIVRLDQTATLYSRDLDPRPLAGDTISDESVLPGFSCAIQELFKPLF